MVSDVCVCVRAHVLWLLRQGKKPKNLLLDHMNVLCDFQHLSSFFLSGYLWNMLYEG